VTKHSMLNGKCSLPLPTATDFGPHESLNLQAFQVRV
jgi:hypothetical protein